MTVGFVVLGLYDVCKGGTLLRGDGLAFNSGGNGSHLRSTRDSWLLEEAVPFVSTACFLTILRLAKALN